MPMASNTWISETRVSDRHSCWCAQHTKNLIPPSTHRTLRRMLPKVKMTYLRTEKGHFVCPECGVVKERQNTMFYHMKKHAGDLSHPCTMPGCGKAFIQKSGLQQHMMQAHPVEGGSVYSCPCCSHTCKMKANLIIHIGRKHGAGWIPAPIDNACSGCKKEFSSVTAYYYHAVQCFRSLAPASAATGLNAL